MGPLLAVSIASLAAVGVIEARLAASHTKSRIEGQLRGVVEVLTTSNFPLTAPVLRKMRDLSSAEFALTDGAGQMIATSLPEPPPQFVAGAAVTRVSQVALGPTLVVAGRDYFYTAIDLQSRQELLAADSSLAGSGERSEERTLHILFPREEYLRSWRQAFVPPLVIGVVTIAAAAAVARLLAGRISRVTAQLGEGVQRLARGDFSPVDLPAVDDEVRDLAQAVNRTAGMLADYEQQVRRTEQMRTVARLGASLAHEMRNAATGCRMAVDLHAELCPMDHDDDSLAVAKRQLRLMESQLQRFLQLGKRPAQAILTDVDFAALVTQMLPLVRPAATHAKVRLDWRATAEELIVHGDEEGLGQVAMNLILNAIEAVQQQSSAGAPPRSVTVELCRSAQGAELVVSDTGPGPDAATAPAIFEPFVSSKAEGAGLGLAVAKQVVEAHEGTIAWTRALGVTRFRVTLPTVIGANCRVFEKEAPCV